MKQLVIKKNSLNFILIFFLLISSFKVYSIESALKAYIVNQGIIEPFKTKNQKSGKPFTFEPSAVFLKNEQIVLVNDRPLPHNFSSQAVSFNKNLLNNEFINSNDINPVDFSLLNDSSKIESATQSFDQSITFAATSFTYFRKNEAEKDKYNRILYWPKNHLSKAKIINPSERDGVISSMVVRQQITEALASSEYPNGPRYFKIEGLSYAPNDKLIFGIRKMGNSYSTAVFQFILLEAQIEFIKNKSGDMTLELSNFKKIYQPSKTEILKRNKYVNYPIGISSIEYDTAKKGFYILTSFEDEDNIGAYLWFYRTGKTPQLVFRKKNTPLMFNHKAEGMLIIDSETLLIIHDDDREIKMVNTGKSITRRKINQGIFSIVKIEK